MTIHRWQGTDGALLKAANYSSGIAPSVAAAGILTLANPQFDSETVVIDTKTYTFKTAINDANDGEVLISASASDSLDNLIAAITLDTPVAGRYATATILHPTVTAVAGAGDTMDASAKVLGSDANTLATNETLTNGSWGGGTLSGGTEWAITDKVVWDKTSTQPVTIGIGATSPVVRIALAWIQEGYREDFSAFDFSPDKLVHQGEGRMVVNLPSTGVFPVIVVDSVNAIEAMLLDGPIVADPIIVVKSGKLTIAGTFDDILYLHVLTAGEVDLPVSTKEAQTIRVDGGIVTNYRKVTASGGVTYTGIITVANGYLTQEGDQTCTQLIIGRNGSVIWNSTSPPIIVDVHDGGIIDFNQDTAEKFLTSLNAYPGSIIRQAEHVNVTLFRDYRKDVP